MNCDFHLPLPMQLPQVLQINWVQSHQWPIWYSSNWIAHCRFCLTYICNFLFRLYIWIIMQQYAYKGRKGQRIIIFNALREFCFNSKSTNPPFSLDPGRKDQTLECYLAHKHFLLLLVCPWLLCVVWVGLRVCLWREYICIGTVVMSLLLCKVEWPEQLQVQIPFPSCHTASTGGTTRSHTADLEHKVCVCLRLAKHGTLYSFLKSEV